MRQAGKSRSKSIPIAIFKTYDLFQETLKELFPSCEAVERYREMVLFVAGLMKDSRPLVQFVYEMYVEECLYRFRTGVGFLGLIDTDLFKLLNTESTVQVVDHPLHNKYINYYRHDEYGDPDATPVYFPSRLYYFYDMIREVVLENHQTQEEEIPPCAMYIWAPDEVVRDSLLSICSEIFTHQPVTDLEMGVVVCNSLEAPRLMNPGRVVLSWCKLSDVFLEKILRQLIECHCGESFTEAGAEPHESGTFRVSS